MTSTSLARRCTEISAAVSQQEPFMLPDLHLFTSIPEYHHGIATLRGAVVVYATDTLFREGVIDGAFYVIENQHPPSNMEWRRWLRLELADENVERRCQPFSPLTTSRTVVQIVRCPSGQNRWWRRLPSGFSDGPLEHWSIGFNIVGKVVGLYAPDYGQKGEH